MKLFCFCFVASSIKAGAVPYENCKTIDPPGNASDLNCSGNKCAVICNPGYSSFEKSTKQCRENQNGYKFWNRKLSDCETCIDLNYNDDLITEECFIKKGKKQCRASCSNGWKINAEGKKRSKINSKCRCFRKRKSCDWMINKNPTTLQLIEDLESWFCEDPNPATTTTVDPDLTTLPTVITTADPHPHVCDGSSPPAFWKTSRCTSMGKDHYCARNPQQTITDTKTSPEWTENNYSQALHHSILFYEAQRSGVLPKSQRVTWRGDAHLNDGCDIGADLTGGWYDAGDFVKFSFPGSAACTILAWGIVEFGEAYDTEGELLNALRQVKWYGDFIIKSSPEPGIVYGQVGDGVSDHQYWGRPENIDTSQAKRDTFVHNSSKPASDLAGEMSAALSAIAKAFKMHGTQAGFRKSLFEDDKGSSFLDFQDLNEMLETYEKHARDLLKFAEDHTGKYSASNYDGHSFYPSHDDKDEAIWAAVWMAYNTGAQSDLEHANQKFDCSLTHAELSWDDKQMGSDLIMAIINPGHSCAKTKTESNIDGILARQQSPNGLVWVLMWGSARYAANLAFYTTVAHKNGFCNEKETECWTFALKQVNYMFDGTGHSLIIGGPGPNPAKNPHHASSFCKPYPASCGWDGFSDNSIHNHWILYGALLGGPDALDDKHVDDRTDWIENEVTNDYNAGFQGALAGVLALGGETGLPTTIQPTTIKTTSGTTQDTTTSTSSHTTTINGQCSEISGLTLVIGDIWWGGGEYYVKGNFPDMSGSSEIRVTLDIAFEVYETWWPFTTSGFSVVSGSNGRTVSLPLMDGIGDISNNEIGFLINHQIDTNNGIYNAKLIRISHC